MKPKQAAKIPPKITDLQGAGQAVAEKSTFHFGKTYVILLRQHQNDPFHNLWEAALLDPKAVPLDKKIKVIDDANALNFAIENIMGEFESDGY
jgi:hypothetical protein